MKLQKQSTRKIDITQINITPNIRKQYDDIESLARSIERDGQLQPIGVSEQEDGTYNMLYGFRRLNAFLFLIKENKDFNQIEAKITTGDPAIIQLIENIHRDNLKPIEFENALQALIDSGLSQKEIANRLNIRQTRVSDALASKKTRDSLKKKNIDTTEMSTSTISALRSVPEDKQKEVVEKVKEKGGTVKAVKEVLGVKKEIVIDPRTEDGKKKIKEMQKRNSKLDLVNSKPIKGNKEIKTKVEVFDEKNEDVNPTHCTKPEPCDNQTGCKICSFNIENHQILNKLKDRSNLLKRELPIIKEKIEKTRNDINNFSAETQEEKAHIEISIRDFLRLQGVKEIITKQNYILRSTCEHCGKEL